MTNQQRLIGKIRNFIDDQGGATAIEYALIAAIMCVGLVAAFKGLRTETGTAVDGVSTAVANSTS